jgi:hypothetical protein
MSTDVQIGFLPGNDLAVSIAGWQVLANSALPHGAAMLLPAPSRI